MKYTNLEYLKTTCAGSMEMVTQIIEMFLKSSPEGVVHMKDAFGSNNWDKLNRDAHKAKSSFLMMGAKLTGDKLAQIELGSANPDIDKLNRLISEVEEESSIIYNELKQELITA